MKARNREVSLIRGKVFAPRPDRPIIPYMTSRGVSLARMSFTEPPPAPPQFLDARALERDRMAAEMLHDAVRLARLIPRYEPPRAWIVKAEREVRQ